MEKTFNKIELKGYVGLAPEIKEFENGGKIARISLATNEYHKNKEGAWVVETTWHRVIFRNKSAIESMEKVEKGSLVHVLGKISNRNWTDSEGNKHNITEIIATEFTIEKEEREEKLVQEELILMEEPKIKSKSKKSKKAEDV